jgi:hypothetical protein
VALLCSAALGLLGCGSLGGTAQIPSDARTLDISHIVNKTPENALDLDLAKQLELTITREGRLRPMAESADLRLSTEIQRFQVIPLQFDAFQKPVRFKMSLAVDLELMDLRSGRQLWSTHHSVHMTPTDEGHDEESFDSLNLSTLRLDQTYWDINSLGQATEDPAVVKQRLLKLAAEKIWKKIQTGFFRGE